MDVAGISESGRESIHEDRASLLCREALRFAVAFPRTVHRRKSHHHEWNLPISAEFVDDCAKCFDLVGGVRRQIRRDASRSVRFALIPEDAVNFDFAVVYRFDAGVVHFRYRPPKSLFAVAAAAGIFPRDPGAGEIAVFVEGPPVCRDGGETGIKRAGVWSDGAHGRFGEEGFRRGAACRDVEDAHRGAYGLGAADGETHAESAFRQGVAAVEFRPFFGIEIPEKNLYLVEAAKFAFDALFFLRRGVEFAPAFLHVGLSGAKPRFAAPRIAKRRGDGPRNFAESPTEEGGEGGFGDNAGAFDVGMDFVFCKNSIHIFTKGLLHVDADRAGFAGDALEVALHKKRLGAAVEFLSFGEGGELGPDEELDMRVGFPVVGEEGGVVGGERAAFSRAGEFLDVFAAVVYAEIAHCDVRLPGEGVLVFRHPPEAAFLGPAHGIEIHAAAGVAEVPDLVFPGVLFVQHPLQDGRIGFRRAVAEAGSVGDGIADAGDFRLPLRGADAERRGKRERRQKAFFGFHRRDYNKTPHFTAPLF